MSRDDLVDDSGAPNAFENDGYDEPGPESDEALTHALPAAGTTASDVDARDYVLRACYGHLKARGVVGDGDKARENRKVVRPLVFDGDSLLLVPPYGSIQCAVFGELVDDDEHVRALPPHQLERVHHGHGLGHKVDRLHHRAHLDASERLRAQGEQLPREDRPR